MKRVLLMVWILAFTACESSPQTEQPVESTPSESAEPKAAPPESHPASGGTPVEQLNAMDPRTPVPLQPMMAWHQKQNMMEHLVAIQRINDGLARDDWSAVKEASALIESSPQMQQMCRHMGAGAEGFTELALEFHRRADQISVAANEKDTKKALAATAHTLEACTSCHQAYRQDVVTAAKWQELTGESHVP